MTERYNFPLGSFGGVFGTSAELKTEGQVTPYDAEAIAGEQLENTWFDLVVNALAEHGEDFADAIAWTETIAVLCRVPDYGDKGWTLWTTHRVYFPTVYDGNFGVSSVSRSPSHEATKPIGGGG